MAPSSPDSLRVLQVINVRWHNATAWYALRQAKLLQDAGHEVLVLSIPGSPVLDEARALGLETEALPLNTRNPLRLARLPWDLIQLLRVFQPQVVNCHRGESFLFFGLLRRLSKRFALVRTRGDQRLPKANRINRWLHARVADMVVAANPDLFLAFRRNLRVPKERLRLIYGGVDTKAFSLDAQGRERVRQEFGFAPEHRVIGLLGRFDRVKGHLELFQAVARLKAEGRQDPRILLIGFATAASDQDVADWVREAGVEDIVRVTGRRRDVAACISALDLAVIPSLWSEAIARSAMEIMACGVPLLTSSVGVLPRLMPSQALFAPGDVDAMAELLGRCLDEEGFADALKASQQRRLWLLADEEFLRRSVEALAMALQRADIHGE